MPKTRVYELAKKLGLNAKDLMEILKDDFDITVKSHMSTLDDDTVEALIELYDDDSSQKPNKNEENNEENNNSNIDEIVITSDDLTLDKFAKKLGKNQNDLIKVFFMQGKMLKPGQDIDFATAETLAMHFNILISLDDSIESETTEGSTDDFKDILKERWEKIYTERKDNFKLRAPVVTVMGHVDHGKTTLLDNIRNTSVAEREAGGITQSIGAYQAEYNGKKITFIDTPGHEAFTEMRARGAQSTDIVILIVAADDGVMPQTIEAYNHAKDAGVPIIVAINKVDKPNANLELTKQELVAKLNLIPEDWGGDAITIPLSAKSGEGIEELLEMILLVSEMQEIKCFPKGNARGVIVESKLDKFLGPVATVIIKDGVLKNGDFFVAGSTFGKVRRLIDGNGKTIKQAGPSTPVQILGFDEVPDMHSIIYGVKTLDEARDVAGIAKEYEDAKMKKANKKHVKLEDLMNMMNNDQKPILNIILKASTYGEIEALKNSISKLENEDIDIQIVHAGIGAITVSDVMLASASNAVIMGFRVKSDSMTNQKAEKEGIQIKRYDIIFQLIDELKRALQGMLEPVQEEEITGAGEIREVFKVKKVGNIAGCIVNEGTVYADGSVRIYRNGKLLQDVKIETLQRYQETANKVEAGKECGIKFLNYNDISAGDELEFYKYIEVEKEIDFGNKK